MGTWVGRSGQKWKTVVSPFAGLVGVLLIFLGFTIGGKGSAPLCLFGFALLGLDLVVPMLVRCRVCGQRLESTAAAREMTSVTRVSWIRALAACPVCGDDGFATGERVARWKESGATREESYWSRGRILLAILVALLFVCGGVAVGTKYRVSP